MMTIKNPGRILASALIAGFFAASVATPAVAGGHGKKMEKEMKEKAGEMKDKAEKMYKDGKMKGEKMKDGKMKDAMKKGEKKSGY